MGREFGSVGVLAWYFEALSSIPSATNQNNKVSSTCLVFRILTKLWLSFYQQLLISENL